MKIRLGLLSNHSSTNSLVYLPETFEVKTFIECMNIKNNESLTDDDRSNIYEWFDNLINEGFAEGMEFGDDEMEESFTDIIDAYVVQEVTSEPGESLYTLLNKKDIQNRIKEIEQNDKNLKSDCTIDIIKLAKE